MGKTEDLIKLDRFIKDSEVRLNTFQVQINTVQKEIDFLLNLEDQLENNISYLKKNKTIALVDEYKKAKETLKKTRTRLIHLKSDKITAEKAYRDILNILEKNKELYQKMSKESQNNVLQGKFGKKRD